MGNVGTYSGPIGATVQANVTVMNNWVKQVNAAGGINGHPVQIISVDDANDPGKNLTEAEGLVKNQHVIGFVTDQASVSGFGSVSYRTSQKVPTIGGGLEEKSWFTSPMYFAEGPSTQVLNYGLLSQAKGTKFALFGCNAGAACNQFTDYVTQAARKNGVPIVNRQTLGLTQTDFSANCLAAQSAGANAVEVVLATAGVMQVMVECARLGYHPTYYVVSSTSNEFLTIPGVKVISVQGWFPFFLTTGSPAIEQWAQASKSVRSQLTPLTASTWVSLELFKKAASIGIPVGGTPTSAMLLKGLWRIKNDTLGGLVVPLTFTPGQPSPPGNCWIAEELSNGKWASIDDAKPQCVSPAGITGK
jgi:branched-chain amino acid transport system substrate-binding protein